MPTSTCEARLERASAFSGRAADLLALAARGATSVKARAPRLPCRVLTMQPLLDDLGV